MLTEGQLIANRYRIVRLLKKGGMGAIYEAFDDVLRSPVVVKQNCVADPGMRAAFEREAQLLANLSHNSLPRCKDLMSEGGGQFLILEFVEGEDLKALMTRKRTWLPNETVADLAWQLLDALEHIHGESVLHRDIKPANIKFNGGRAYLLDFGIAYGQSGEMDTVDADGFNWGYRSKRYSLPEQPHYRRTSPSGDLYSLAATLYYTLTNVEPVDAEERYERVSRGERDPLEDVRLYNPAADEVLSRAVMWALSLDADERPQSVAELRGAMFHEPVVRGFLTARLLSEAVALVALACLIFFVLRPSVSGQADAAPLPPHQIDRPAPVEPVTQPTPSPTPPPAEEAARLAGEAERLRQRGYDREAWNVLEEASELNESDPYIHYLFGDILWESITDNGEFHGRIHEVEEQADHVLKLVRSPGSAREQIARAWANFAKANLDRRPAGRARLDRAIADADEVLTKYDQDSVGALLIRAAATYLKAGPQLDAETARRVLADSERAVELAPEYAQAHANLAEIHFALGLRAVEPARAEHLELARRGFGRAAELVSRAGFYKNIGDVYFEMGDFENAADSFEKSTRVDGTYYQAFIGLGDACIQTGRWAEAVTNYLRANDLNETSNKLKVYVLRKLKVAYHNLKQFDRAEECQREALNLAQGGTTPKEKESSRISPRGGPGRR